MKYVIAQGQGKDLGKSHWRKHLLPEAPRGRKVGDLKPTRKMERQENVQEENRGIERGS